MNTKLTILAVAGALLAMQAASAGYIRCGGQVIEDSRRSGPGKYEVLKKCGKPKAQFGNTWIYSRGGKEKVIRFNDAGQINTIQDG